MLGVLTGGSPDDGGFFENVESCTVDVVTLSGDGITCSEPVRDPNFTPAERVSTIIYTGSSGSNELHWTLKMNNSDTIILKQSFSVTPLQILVYTPDDVPLETTEDLATLIQAIEREAPADAIADIHLAPVTYEGDIVIQNHAVNLYGGSDGENRTTFTGKLSIATDIPSNVMIDNISFVGSGGTGLAATASVYMTNCSFTGYDVGASALDGGMIGVSSCEFIGNGVGFLYNTRARHSFNDTFADSLFENNGTGVRFAYLEGTVSIDFAGTSFVGNGNDIDNIANYPINTENAVFDRPAA